MRGRGLGLTYHLIRTEGKEGWEIRKSFSQAERGEEWEREKGAAVSVWVN